MSRPTDRELYRLFDRSPIGMYRSTEDGRFLYANPALASMLGYTSDEILAVNLNNDIYADRDERPRLIAAYRSRGVIDGVRARWRTKDNRPLLVRIFGHVVEDAGTTTFDASVLDITAIESANEELERTARTLDLVVRQVPAMYWLVDHDLRILRTGGAIEQVLGYAPDRWLGATLHEVHRAEGGTTDSIVMHGRALAGETVTYQTEYRSKTLHTTVAPLRSGDRITGVIGTALDVTAVRALERRMVDAQRAESLGVLAGGLAHDFNNLLVAILGNADLALREMPSGSPGRATLDNIRQAALRAAELTDQLLAYAGRGAMMTTRVAPREIVGELLRISAPAMPANVVVDVDITNVDILADASQVRQVVLNLIANARDALGSRGGRIAITGRLVQHDGAPVADDIVTAPAGRYVELAFADDGPGMNGETRRRVFEPFFTTKETGHGLGLAAVLGIVRAHAGGLRVVSSPGHGACFVVSWPAAATAPEQPAVAPPARTVLVIDDEDLVRDVLARMLEDLGYAAVTAADGPTGIEVFDHHAVDAVLVDLTMPRMSGADVVAALRSRRPTLPIVLCTGYDRERRGPVDADAYLPKPFRIEALEAALAKIFA